MGLGLIGSPRVLGGGPLYSTPCTRVFTTSNIKVASQPLIPARAPAVSRAGHDNEFVPPSPEGGGVKYRRAPSY